MLQSIIHATILGITLFSASRYISALEIDDIAIAEILQVPSTLSNLLRENSGNSMVLTKRIVSVRPGEHIHVGITMPKEAAAGGAPNLSDIIAAVYSASDGSLVRVLDKGMSQQTMALHNMQPLKSHNLPLRISTDGLCARKPFEVYKLALIAPEKDLSGTWTSYSAATMLFAYDSAS